MNLMEPIEGDRAAGPEDYFQALTDYETPLDKYLVAKLGQGWRNSWAGQITSAKSLPDTALFRIQGEPLKAVLGLIPAAKHEPGYAPNQPSSQLPHDIIVDRLNALPEDERRRVLPQVEQALKQRGFKFYTEDEWRASPHYRDMPFEPFMTEDRAKAKADIYENNRVRDWLIAHRPDGAVSGTLGFLAGTAGGLVDPSTLVGGFGGKLITSLGRAGAANLFKAAGIGAADGGVSSLLRDYTLRHSLAKWGEDKSDGEIWGNAGWGAAIGAGLGGGFQGVRMLRSPNEPAGGGGARPGRELGEQLDSTKGTPKLEESKLGNQAPSSATEQVDRLVVQADAGLEKLLADVERRQPWLEQQSDDAAKTIRVAAQRASQTSKVPIALRNGRLTEPDQLQVLGSSGKFSFTPTVSQLDSSAFKLMVGEPEYTPNGRPVGVII